MIALASHPQHYRKGDPLARQCDAEMEQFFILEGMLKRVTSNPEGRETILRFTAQFAT